MNPNQNRLIGLPLPFDQSDMIQTVARLTERNQLEVSPLGRHIHHLASFDNRLRTQTIGDDIRNRDDLHSVLLGYLHQVRHTGHRSILVHDLDQRPTGLQAGHTRQIDHGFGVSRTAQHAPIAGPQREDVSRTSQIGCPRGRIDQRTDRSCTVVCRNPCRTALPQQVNRHRKRSSQQRRIGRHLHIQIELSATILRQRCAQYAPSVMQHEIDDLGCDFLARHNKIALIFAIFIIYNDYDLSGTDILQYLIDRTEYSFSILFL